MRRSVGLWVLTLCLFAVATPSIDRAVAQGDIGAQGDLALSQRQAAVAERYQKLEELLLRLADVESSENPERAALLRRAARQSRDQFVLEKLRIASQSLETEEFQKAVENQETAEKELSAILRLLLSEDRSKRIRDEKERYRKLIKDLKRNLNNQRSTRARTENGADLDEVQKEQQSVTERSEELRKALSDEDASEADSDSDESSPSSSEQAEASDQQGDQSSGEKEPSSEESSSEESGKEKEPGRESDEEQQAKPSKEGEEQSKPGEKSPSEAQESSGEPSQSEQNQSQQSQGQESQQQSQSQQSQSQQSQSQQSQSQQSDSQQPQTPEQEVEQQLQEAIKRMQEAERELERAKRDEATDQQRKAEENLRAAIDRLERILRQLREEEMQRELAKLEARLRKMAAMQSKVLDDTIALAATPLSQRNRQTDLKAGDLAFEEKKITMEADRAMLLLREEGSSVAFPEVVAQIRSDTARVAELLGRTKIDAIAQGIQQDILAALEEMIAALQKAQRDLEKQRQQRQQGQSPPPGQQEQPLVEAIAELKLIRTMEVRIKSTTDRYSALIESGDSSIEEMLPLLQDLSERQDRIDRITRDLVSKRNQ